jgi:steroid 5-alpha reductase family enzyme
MNLVNGFVLVLVALWALRLSIHLTVRNWGEPEDRRYQEIRRNNEPYFGIKSLYIIFGLQGLLAWIISIPLLFALTLRTSFHWLDAFALMLWLVGFVFEAVADFQLLRFKRNESNRGKVLDTGLWHYSRHPNYFGEFCIWWGFFLLAIPAGGWWTIYAPLLMSFLLLKVSGVVLMEKDIGNRRPEYQDYIERTNAFFPGRPKQGIHLVMEEQS